MSTVMYGVGVTSPDGIPFDRDDWQRRLDDLRRSVGPMPGVTFTLTSTPATKADLDAAVARIEVQMLALLAEMTRLAAKPKRKAKRAKAPR